MATEQDVKKGVYIGYILPPEANPDPPDRIFWGKVVEVCPAIYGRTLPCVRVEIVSPIFQVWKDTELVLFSQIVQVREGLLIFMEPEGENVELNEENLHVGYLVGYRMLKIDWPKNPGCIWHGKVVELVRSSPDARPYACEVECIDPGYEGLTERVQYRQIVWIRRPKQTTPI